MATGQASRKIEIWHVAHPVTDLDRSVAFYCDHLGFDLVGRDAYPTMRQAFVALGQRGFTIELFVPLGEEADKPRRAPDHLAFEAIDLVAYREGVIAAGLPVPPIEVFEGGM
jgi:catechol 2,3-dioxygenase-like lactoylglutathione lyase family enzyme